MSCILAFSLFTNSLAPTFAYSVEKIATNSNADRVSTSSEAKRTKYDILYESSDGIRFTGPKTVKTGNDLIFYAKAKKGYEITGIYADNFPLDPLEEDDIASISEATRSSVNSLKTQSLLKQGYQMFVVEDIEDDVWIYGEAEKEDNLLNISVIDENGNEIIKKKNYSLDGIVDDGEMLSIEDIVNNIFYDYQFEFLSAYTESGDIVTTVEKNDDEIYLEKEIKTPKKKIKTMSLADSSPETTKYNGEEIHVQVRALINSNINIDPNISGANVLSYRDGINSDFFFPDPDPSWTKDNMSFVGYCENADGNGTIYKPGDKVSYPFLVNSTDTYYVIYGTTINFNPNDGNGSSFVLKAPHGTALSMPNKPSDYNKSGYEFIGWSTNPNGNGSINDNQDTVIYHPNSTYYIPQDAVSVTFYALYGRTNHNGTFFIRLDGQIPYEPGGYDASQYTEGISINGVVKIEKFISDPTGKKILENLNSLPTDEQIKAVCEKAGIEYDPAKQKIIWYVIKNASNDEYMNVDGVLLDKSMYTLTYNVNCYSGEWDGTLPFGRQYREGEEAKVEGADSFSREGYIFQGWNTKSDGSGQMYQPGETIVINADTNLYAIWKAEDKFRIYMASTIDGSLVTENDFIYEVKINGYTPIEVTEENGYADLEIQNSILKGKETTIWQSVGDRKDIIYDTTIYKIKMDNNGTVSYEVSKNNGQSFEIYLPAMQNNSPIFIFDNQAYKYGTVTIEKTINHVSEEDGNLTAIFKITGIDATGKNREFIENVDLAGTGSNLYGTKEIEIPFGEWAVEEIKILRFENESISINGIKENSFSIGKDSVTANITSVGNRSKYNKFAHADYSVDRIES